MKIVSLFLAQFALVNLLALQSRFVRDSQSLWAAANSLALGVCGLVITPVIATDDLLNESPGLMVAYLSAGPLAVCAAIWIHDRTFATSRRSVRNGPVSERDSMATHETKTIETTSGAEGCDPSRHRSPGDVADWLSTGNVSAADRIDLFCARLIAEAFETHNLKWSDPFEWSQIFTAYEINGGAVAFVPDWFVRGDTDVNQVGQRLSDTFLKRFVYARRRDVVLTMKDYLSPPARVLESSGISAGALLLSLDGREECKVTALGARVVIGYWLTKGGEPVTGMMREEVLQLNHHDWRVYQ